MLMILNQHFVKLQKIKVIVVQVNVEVNFSILCFIRRFIVLFFCSRWSWHVWSWRNAKTIWRGFLCLKCWWNEQSCRFRFWSTCYFTHCLERKKKPVFIPLKHYFTALRLKVLLRIAMNQNPLISRMYKQKIPVDCQFSLSVIIHRLECLISCLLKHVFLLCRMTNMAKVSWESTCIYDKTTSEQKSYCSS